MPLRNDLLNPIDGDNPSGTNLRYDAVTEKIKEARREDLDVPQGQWKTALKAADLPAVIKLSSDVLAKRSKDLQIAVWLVDAQVRKEGFVTLAPAFQFLRDLLEQFWDTLYPPIDEDGDMEVRAAPLVWLGAKFGEQLGFLPIVSGKLSWNKFAESRKVGTEADADTYEKQQARQNAINDGKITPEQFDEAADATSIPALRETYKQLTEAQGVLESLIEYCDTQFGDFSPSFIKTRDALEEIAQTVRIILSRRPGGLEEPEAEGGEATESSDYTEEPVAEEVAPADDEPEEDEAPVRSSSRGSMGAPTSRADVAQQLDSICRYLRKQDPADPTPYLIARCFAWAGLMLNAPSINRGILEAPPTKLRINLKKLNNDSNWDELLDGTESALFQPYGGTWLDMQRYAVNALEQKSLNYTAIVLNGQLRMLVEMLPDITTLTLPDDTLSANGDTKDWIDQSIFIRRVASSSDSAESGESTESTEETPSDSFSFDDSPSDTSSWDTPSESASTPEPEPEATPEPEPEPEPYVVEENPPILEAEEPPPTDTSDEFGMALAAVRDGRTAEGLGMITSILATERSGRARFRRRTQLAHLLMAAGKGKVAQPLLDQLAAEIEDRRLEEWEPSEAIAYPLELLMHCLTSADDERRAQLYTRICKLDPVRAVNCST